MLIPNSILYLLIYSQYFTNNTYLNTEGSTLFEKQGFGSSNTRNFKKLRLLSLTFCGILHHVTFNISVSYLCLFSPLLDCQFCGKMYHIRHYLDFMRNANIKCFARWMDKGVVVHIYNGILLSYKKECIWVSSNEVDETGAYYTEWSKSERDTLIQYINAYVWNLERW